MTLKKYRIGEATCDRLQLKRERTALQILEILMKRPLGV